MLNYQRVPHYTQHFQTKPWIPWPPRCHVHPSRCPQRRSQRIPGRADPKCGPLRFLGEMAMEIWGKHGEKPWKSMGNPWEKVGTSGRSRRDSESSMDSIAMKIAHGFRCFARQNVEWGFLWHQQQKCNSHHKPSMQIYQTEHEDILRPQGSVQ